MELEREPLPSLPPIQIQEPLSPQLQAIVEILKTDPLLTECCLAWIKESIGKINLAKLKILRGEEGFNQLVEKAQRGNS